LDSADDTFFEVGRVLLHYYDGFLEGIFFVDLFLELAGNGCVCYVAVGGEGWGVNELGGRRGVNGGGLTDRFWLLRPLVCS
jgi:hypothetical protein